MAKSEYRVSQKIPKKMWISFFDTTYYETTIHSEWNFDCYDIKLNKKFVSFYNMTFKILF